MKTPTSISILASVATALLLFAGHSALAEPPPCDLQIKACGCVIKTSAPDVYEAAGNLSAGQTKQPNCIEIAAPRAILNLKGRRVFGKGNGTGIGILIRKGADHVIVEGGDEAADSNAQALVSKWKTGLEDDADDAVVLLFESFGGVECLGPKDCHTPGNAVGGVLLAGVSHTVVGNSRAGFNGKFGVMLTSNSAKGQAFKNSSDATLFNVTTKGNGDTGVVLDSAPNNFLGQATSGGNMTYGILLRSSMDNLIVDGAVSGNKKVGILLGDGHQSNDNFVVNSQVTGSEMGGIRIQKVNRQNIVTVNRTSGNGKFDLIDENPHCDNNRWYNNMGTGQPSSCVQ